MDIAELTVVQNTYVVLKWPDKSNNNVYKVEKADFESCKVNKADQKATFRENPYSFKASSVGTSYYINGVQTGEKCESGSKLKITVTSDGNALTAKIPRLLYRHINPLAPP